MFSSVTDSRVVEGILDLSIRRSFNFVVSCSQNNRDIVRGHRGQYFEDIIDPSRYDIFPFEDKECHTHVIKDLRRTGVLAQIMR